MDWRIAAKLAATMIAMAFGSYSLTGPGWWAPNQGAWRVSVALTAALIALIWWI